jgi:hypothetical protein
MVAPAKGWPVVLSVILPVMRPTLVWGLADAVVQQSNSTKKILSNLIEPIFCSIVNQKKK